MRTSILLAFTLISLHHKVFAAALPNQYTVTDLPAASGAVFQPRRINNHGEILGHFDFSEGPFRNKGHAAFYRADTTVDLHLLISNDDTNYSSFPNDLNDRGEAIFHGESEYYLYRNGQLEIFPQPSPDLFEPVALNNAGCVAGTLYYSNSFPQAVIYKHGSFQLLGLPGVPSEAVDINNGGLILGVSGGEGVFFQRNKIVDLGEITRPRRANNRGDVLASTSQSGDPPSGVVRLKNKTVPLPFEPSGINAHGQIVGSNGVLYQDGVTYNLNDFVDRDNTFVVYAFDINDRGQIVCLGRGTNHTWSGLLLTPSNQLKKTP